ncbi:MAG: hypothetical protein JSW11_12120 [Candidatus Heimdallarchaeota archaeon]|nr:MAG: hypothetical protein JSW11_12120 [Candidatus Heimdallarchaeota archaeon]
MLSQETSSDILVIHQDRIIFSSGQGPLARHSKISATVTQVLTLFSERIMKGEQIHFIRFEKHRMIFLFSQNIKDDNLVAIVLIPIERSPRQVIPAMSIILRMLEESLKGNIEDAQAQHLDCFYQILSSPEKALFIVPRQADGILASLVILTAFAHDMRLGIHQITTNMTFVDPRNMQELHEVIEKSKTKRILSFVPLPLVEENENVLFIGSDLPRRQYFSAHPGERIYDVISRIFGNQSNAAKMRNLISNNDARELAHSISMFPPSENDFIRTEILLSTVLQPGKDIIVTMSSPVMQKLRELTPTEPITREAPIEEEIHVPKEPIITGKPIVDEIPIVTEPKVHREVPVVKEIPPITPELDEIKPKVEVTKVKQPEYQQPIAEPIFELVADPDAFPHVIPEETSEVVSEPIESVEAIAVSDIGSDVLARLDEARERGFEYRFDSIPLILDTTPYLSNIPGNVNIPAEESTITLRLFQGEDNHLNIHIYTTIDRLSGLRDSLEDLTIRTGGEIHLKKNHVSLTVLIDKQQIVLRALLWLSIVEYLTQVRMGLMEVSELFKIPNEGSILIIPPKRDYIKDKIPSKFQNFIEESKIRNQFEQEDLWTLGKSQNEILSHLMAPLKQGDGVVFVASDNNQEMEEIALFLLFVSEACGIGFSRW